MVAMASGARPSASARSTYSGPRQSSSLLTGDGAQGANAVEAALTGDADDGGAPLDGELHRHRADSARGRTDHEHVAAGDVECAQRTGCRLNGDSERGRPNEVESVGLAHDCIRRNHEPVSQCARVHPAARGGARGPQDRVPYGDGGDPLADGVDDSRIVPPHAPRQRRGIVSHHAGEDLPVHGVEARRLDGDADLTGSRHRLRDLDHLKDLGTAVAPILDRSHPRHTLTLIASHRRRPTRLPDHRPSTMILIRYTAYRNGAS